MIYVECKADLALVKSITSIPKKEIIHRNGKSGVCQKLKENKNCKGMVDEDPGRTQPPYMRKLRLENELAQDELKVFHDESNRNRIFILCPALEEWILKAAKEADLDIERYSLPSTSKKLHRVINLDLSKFERLLEVLKDKAPERLKALKKLLET